MLLRLKEAVRASGGEELGGVMMSGSGTSVYSISRAGGDSSQRVQQVLAQFPQMRHFRCSFISKKDDIYSWY